MIYTDKTKRAMCLCYEAHAGQVDKGGVPYVFHPIHLAEQMPDETTTIVALLHDVVEDTDYTMADIAKMGFGKDVNDALRLLTRAPDVPYMEYIANLKENAIARTVKLADLRHNCELSRLPVVNEQAEKLVADRYSRALTVLKQDDGRKELSP